MGEFSFSPCFFSPHRLSPPGLRRIMRKKERMGKGVKTHQPGRCIIVDSTRRGKSIVIPFP